MKPTSIDFMCGCQAVPNDKLGCGWSLHHCDGHSGHPGIQAMNEEIDTLRSRTALQLDRIAKLDGLINEPRGGSWQTTCAVLEVVNETCRQRIANYERLAEAVKERHRLFMSPRQDETMKDAQAVYEEEIKALAKCEQEETDG